MFSTLIAVHVYTLKSHPKSLFDTDTILYILWWSVSEFSPDYCLIIFLPIMLSESWPLSFNLNNNNLRNKIGVGLHMACRLCKFVAIRAKTCRQFKKIIYLHRQIRKASSTVSPSYSILPPMINPIKFTFLGINLISAQNLFPVDKSNTTQATAIQTYALVYLHRSQTEAFFKNRLRRERESHLERQVYYCHRWRR